MSAHIVALNKARKELENAGPLETEMNLTRMVLSAFRNERAKNFAIIEPTYAYEY